MKRLFLILGVLCGILLPAAAPALEVPRLAGYVNDYAGMISAGTRSGLEQELRRLEETDSTQVVILTIPSLQGEALEEFSIKVADAWKIGQRQKDNGVILLVARDDRKVRIEVGRGLEGKLTDLVSGRVIREFITPSFKAGNYDEGFTVGIQAITAVVRGEFTAAPSPESRGQGRSKTRSHAVFVSLFFLFWAVMLLADKSRILGGLAGALGLPLVFLIFLAVSSLVPLAALALAGFAGGMFLPSVMASSGSHWSRGGRGAGGRHGWWIGGPGGFGGGFSGGGGMGGGFSGGGGGGFGGGGASGSW